MKKINAAWCEKNREIWDIGSANRDEDLEGQFKIMQEYCLDRA